MRVLPWRRRQHLSLGKRENGGVHLWYCLVEQAKEEEGHVLRYHSNAAREQTTQTTMRTWRRECSVEDE